VKAVVYSRYGGPEVLRIEEIEVGAPKDDEVRIRVRAAGVNPMDRHLMRGEPKAGRIAMGLRGPKRTRLGADVTGVVDAVGAKVTKFKVGDEVFGGARGAFAESVCANELKVAAKPKNATFEEAAAVPVAGVTALQALRDFGRVRAGHRVLINGAGGGVGSFAVQIAKAFGATVTGVCGTHNVANVQSIGADRVVDYTRDDFTNTAERYDVIVDMIGNRPLRACKRLLTATGTYVVVGGPLGRLFTTMAAPRCRIAMARMRSDDLVVLRDLIEHASVTPLIDRVYLLAEVPQAIAYLEEGHARGKIVIRT